MHNCLRILEICHHIFGFLVVDFIEICAVRYNDVARLARTCKAFKDPALDVLWRTQSSLSPLAMCLPAHLWAIEVDRGISVLHLLQEPSHEDWLSLKRYSRRIRAFDRNTLYLTQVSKNTLHTFFSTSLSHELFSSLHTLNANVLCGELNPIPSLDHIRLPQLVYLRTITLPHHVDILPSSLRELIHLQYLCNLTVTLPDGFDVNDRSDVGIYPSAQPILPSLQHLSVLATSLKRCFSLLSSITSYQLRSVEVCHRWPATQSDLYTLFQEIERIHERSPNFYTLSVRCSSARTELTSFDLPQSTLTPLLACRRLRVLKLDSIGTLNIGDAFITQVTLAWPDIEALYLEGFQRSKACVTLEGIRELLRGCRQLSSLCMAINTRILPEEDPGVRSLSLKKLRIIPSCMGDWSAIDRYLRILAPRLESLRLK
ncbi:hypothetical protein BKA82DRAFT_994612 [Pisolithus tinctorius]|uniref:F-box domain-containing protein n=1 Tax=Pisolithus tinctorius Marx 270 TaxID=870435 RepID=A0A0C3PT99_PISTI|nr:hypothetical protein BKA82DRAFT_994612 [Pisolithus tinctorius]KIO11919.1 hypothetical protein M404DRAFT_994612 [Pisolithus tinctorius Marx 270]